MNMLKLNKIIYFWIKSMQTLLFYWHL